MKKVLSLILALAMVFALVACGEKQPASDGDASGDGDKPARGNVIMTFGTADTGGSMYPAGAAVSQVWTNNVEGVKCNTQTSTGSFQNCQDVSTGEVDVAVATSDVVLNAYNGTGKFADIGKLDNLRVIGAVYTSVLSGVALKSSGLTYIHELLGKRVAVGPAASATENATLAAFGVMGIDSSNTSLENLGLGDGADSVGDGILDAAFGFGVKEGNSSNFAGSGVEVMKSPYLGKNGHIAVKTNSIPRAAAELAKKAQRAAERARRHAEHSAERAQKHAEDLARKMQRHAEHKAERLERHAAHETKHEHKHGDED